MDGMKEVHHWMAFACCCRTSKYCRVPQPVCVSDHIGRPSSRRGPSRGGTWVRSSAGTQPHSGGSDVASRPCAGGSEHAGCPGARTLYRTASSRRQIFVQMHSWATIRIQQTLYNVIKQSPNKQLCTLLLYTVYLWLQLVRQQTQVPQRHCATHYVS